MQVFIVHETKQKEQNSDFVESIITFFVKNVKNKQ
jgi:hypothetical protein